MTVYRYPYRTLLGDYARAFAGLGVGLGVLLTAPPVPAIVLVFGGMTLLFLVFGLRTVHRQMLRIAVTSEDISSTGLLTRTLPWSALERLNLRYFGTRRQQRERRGGFLQITLRGTGISLRLDSTIDGFEQIARQAARAAQDNGIVLDATSANNLIGIGIDSGAVERGALSAGADRR